MSLRRTLRRTVLPGLALLLARTAPAGSQEHAAPQGDRLVRVYLLATADKSLAAPVDAALLTLRNRSGKGESILLERVSPESQESRPAELPTGTIRGLEGSDAFVQVIWPAVGDASKATPAPPPASSPEAEQAQRKDPRRILRQAHEGPSFAARLSPERLSEVASARVTLRSQDRTWSSEEFPGPTVPMEPVRTSLEGVRNALDLLRERAERGASFMDLRPQVERLYRELGNLAPAGFFDRSGAFELDRQRCLAQARVLDDAVSRGNPGMIADSTLECRPVLQRMESSQPEPTPPAVPTLDHEP